jgi:hypothetical protein
MKIVLVGAPGAGKSKLAASLKRKLGSEWGVIDGYADRLNKQINWVREPEVWETSYVHEIQMMAARWTAEDAHPRSNLITCGSIYETIIYASSIHPWAGDEHMLVEDQAYIYTMMTAFGTLQHKVYDYDIIFYLPWPEEKRDHSWYAVIDAKIPELLVGYGLPFIGLTGTNKQKTNEALKFITAYREATTPEDVE